MIEDEWLSNAVFTTVRSGADLSKVKTGRGDFLTGSLSKAVNSDQSNEVTVRAWLAKAGSRKSTLVFCVDLSHVASLTAMFRQHGVDARFITGDTATAIRTKTLDAFKAGEYPVLLNCGIFTEGTDIPNIDCVVLARPTKSRNLLVQMIGRGLRKHIGKDNCHVIDMVASLEIGVVTAPTLFGLDPQELLDETDAKTMKSLKERKESEQERVDQAASSSTDLSRDTQELTGNITFTDYEDVHDLIEDTKGESHIRSISPYAWVQIDEDRYVLSSGSGDFIQLRKVEEQFEVWFNKKLPSDSRGKSPYMRPRLIAQASTFENGVHAADSFAKATFVYELISNSARWRYGPASENQITYLNKFRGEAEQLEIGSVTKGKAGDRITKIKHGAKGRFKKILNEKRKSGKVEEKKNISKARQKEAQVSIGPIRGQGCHGSKIHRSQSDGEARDYTDIAKL